MNETEQQQWEATEKHWMQHNSREARPAYDNWRRYHVAKHGKDVKIPPFEVFLAGWCLGQQAFAAMF